MSRATGTVPERVQLRVHTTETTGPVPEPFHCDHIARWSARSGTTGRSGTGVNTGARLRSGTVPVPKLWCEHGLRSIRAVCGLTTCPAKHDYMYCGWENESRTRIRPIHNKHSSEKTLKTHKYNYNPCKHKQINRDCLD